MNIQEFFQQNPSCAIAFSGGVDSSYLLYAATKYAKRCKAYYIKSMFQPQFELDDAIELAEQLGCPMEVIPVDVLSSDIVTNNPKDRCYHCKKVVFGTILEQAKSDGFTTILDGTNASDDAGDRPGMKALDEMKVLSPLRECELTKDNIRALSKEANLFTHNKPSYACLATRVPTGTNITAEILQKVEQSEGRLFQLGFSDFRVRYLNGNAKIQLTGNQFQMAVDKRSEIYDALSPHFNDILLDLKER